MIVTIVHGDIYFTDMNVLLYNTPLVDFIWKYIRDTSDIFSIFSPVKISLTSLLFFLCFLSSLFYFRNAHLCNKKNYTLVWTYEARTSEIFFPLEDKLHMFVPPCNTVSSIYEMYTTIITMTFFKTCVLSTAADAKYDQYRQDANSCDRANDNLFIHLGQKCWLIVFCRCSRDYWSLSCKKCVCKTCDKYFLGYKIKRVTKFAFIVV